jgi:hypothetical protein
MKLKKKKVKRRRLLGFNKIPFFPFFLFFPRVLSPATLLPLLHKPRPDFTPSPSQKPIFVAEPHCRCRTTSPSQNRFLLSPSLALLLTSDLQPTDSQTTSDWIPSLVLSLHIKNPRFIEILILAIIYLFFFEKNFIYLFEAACREYKIMLIC